MSVDIRLCGNIPRSDMKGQLLSQGAPCSLAALRGEAKTLSTSRLAVTNAPDDAHSTHRTIEVCESLPALLLHNKSEMRGPLQEKQPLAPLFEPPSWAVPARGETRLEPVCESLGRQYAVDLTKRASFYIGRSPNANIQLYHATSSRRHAMLFHHSNGSCYIIDCGSAHGTFVNGVRIPSPGKGGVVVPHKVRRGALIRFGGPGAPCFVLKSFSFNLQDITMKSTEDSDMGELIRRNTRMNALGKTASEVVRENVCIFDSALGVNRKRSFDSLDSRETLVDEENSICKRRCLSPPLSPEVPLRLVSPDPPSMSKRHVTFSEEPPVTWWPALVTPPDSLSGEEDNSHCEEDNASL